MSQVRSQITIPVKSFNTSAPAYRILTPATGTANAVKVWDTSTCLMVGASVNEASVTGAAIEMAIAGTCKVMAGENLSTGALITAQTATGKAMHAVNEFVTATTQVPRVFGVVMHGASTGSLAEVLIGINNVLIACTGA